jgi:dienelactone hydrolase
MGAYVAYPDKTPVGAVIAIMEIWGVNDTMRQHAHEFAEAGFVCLVPDLFWRQEPGVELSDKNAEDVKKAFDLYYDFDYDVAVRDLLLAVSAFALARLTSVRQAERVHSDIKAWEPSPSGILSLKL